jgi:uncharacterized membrane protein
MSFQPDQYSLNAVAISVEQRFSALRSIGYILRAIAIASVIVVIVLTMIGLLNATGPASMQFVIFQLIPLWIGTLIGAVVLEAYAQLIFLGLSLEHNQRIQTEILRRMLEQQINRG